MSGGFVLLLVCLGVGTILSGFLLVKTIIEIRKMKKNKSIK